MQTWDHISGGFPIDYQQDYTNELITCETQDALLQAIWQEYHTDASEGMFGALLQKIPMRCVQDDTMLTHIQRYQYCESYPSVPPYPGTFNEQPAIWVDIQNVIREELENIRKYRSR